MDTQNNGSALSNDHCWYSRGDQNDQALSSRLSDNQCWYSQEDQNCQVPPSRLSNDPRQTISGTKHHVVMPHSNIC